MGGFAASLSPSPSLQASEDKSDDDGFGGDDANDDACARSFGDKEMTASQLLTLCHS